MRHLDGNESGNIEQSEQRLHIKLKLATLLSQMAKKRLCVDFLEQKDGNLIASLYQNVIEKECLGHLMTSSAALNGGHLKPVVPEDVDY